MDARDKALALFVDALGLQDQLSEFEGRRRFQKAIYLLQQAPFERDFGFHYNLYIRGPYCPALAEAGYRLLQHVQDWQQAREHLELKEDCARQIDTLRGAFSLPDGALDGDLLELAATIHFLLHHTFSYAWKRDWAVSRTRGWVGENKPQLVGRFDEAMERLRSLQMLR